MNISQNSTLLKYDENIKIKLNDIPRILLLLFFVWVFACVLGYVWNLANRVFTT